MMYELMQVNQFGRGTELPIGFSSAGASFEGQYLNNVNQGKANWQPSFKTDLFC
jgi:hypothetical protein